MPVPTNIDLTSAWSFADLTPAKTQYLTHGYHRYPAKFIPQLVGQLIKEYSSPNDKICDPFGGCGTTLVESKLTSRVSFGYDINPVAVMITRAKVNAINPDNLKKKYNSVLQDIENDMPIIQVNEANRLNLSRLHYWFGESNLEELLSIKYRLDQEEEPAVRRFFMCSLSHILKNCSYWLTTSTKPQKDKEKVPDSPIRAFKIHTAYMIERNQEYYEELRKLKHEETPSMMYRADAKKLPLPNECMDLIVTSPPYSTSYEYSDIHQLTALLFGFCTSLSDFRQGFIGSKNPKCIQKVKLGNMKATKAVRDLRLVDKQLANAIQSYFVDMNGVYREMHRVLKRDKLACIVIGNQELRGVQIPNAEVVAEQMAKEGFKVKTVIERPVPSRVLAPYRDKNDGRFTSPKNPEAKKIYSHEYILVLKKK